MSQYQCCCEWHASLNVEESTGFPNKIKIKKKEKKEKIKYSAKS